MSRIGIFTLPHTGHLYPATALGRKLAERGHEVIFFGNVITKAIIRAAGLKLHPLPVRESYASPRRKWMGLTLSNCLHGIQFSTRIVLEEAPEAVRSAGIDALLIDQMDFAAGTVADWLKIPFVSLSIVPPIYVGADIPPIWFGWHYGNSITAQARNRIGNSLFRIFLVPIMAIINQKRRSWRLRPLRHINDLCSNLALISQLPEAFDFPCHGFPSHLFHTGPFHDGQGRRKIPFPWERLNEKPLIYASMGTRKNKDHQGFHIIAEACSGLDVQLVLSLGGNLEDIGALAGNPIVVPYAPQLEIISRASLTITHAGINTTLESLAKGVPLVAVPVGNDQPSVAARIEGIGAGKSVPYKKLSAKRLRNAIQQVMEDPKYRDGAQDMKNHIAQLNGLERAADIVEEVFNKSRGYA
jgi:zeaxanthin glucosyltransferase